MNREIGSAGQPVWWRGNHNRRLLLLGTAGLLGVVLMIVGNMLAPRNEAPAVPPSLGGESNTLSVTPSRQGGQTDSADPSLAALESSMSQRLEEVLGQIAGTGRLRVLVTLSAGAEHLYVYDVSESTQITTESDSHGGQRSSEEVSSQRQLTVQGSPQGGGQSPVVSQVRAAHVRGVLVVAEGADDPLMRLQLVRAVQSLFDVPVHRIQVVHGRSED